MKTIEKNNYDDPGKLSYQVTGKRRKGLITFFIAALMIASTGALQAHCDTMDGPVIKDALLAISGNNVNYILKWVQPGDEPVLREAFALAMSVRGLGPEAKTVADRYLFDTLVRLHRNGEGVGFDGVKPTGTPVDARVLAADRSIETGNLSPLANMVPADRKHELHVRFDRVMALKNYDINDVVAGRKYVMAYVSFFKFAEGEDDAHHAGHAGAESVVSHQH